MTQVPQTRPKWMKRMPDGQVFLWNTENFHNPPEGMWFEPVTDEEKDAIASASLNRLAYNMRQPPQPAPRPTSVMPPFPSQADQPQYAIDHLQPQQPPRFQFEATPGFNNPYVACTVTPVPEHDQEFARAQERDPLPPPRPVPPPQQPQQPAPYINPEMTQQEYRTQVLERAPVSEEAQVAMRESLNKMDMHGLTVFANRLRVSIPDGANEEDARRFLFREQYERLKAANAGARR